MRKLLPAACTMVIISAAMAQDAKKESPFEGWSVVQGEWEMTKDGSTGAMLLVIEDLS